LVHLPGPGVRWGMYRGALDGNLGCGPLARLLLAAGWCSWKRRVCAALVQRQGPLL
jgi:hypothetical protein